MKTLHGKIDKLARSIEQYSKKQNHNLWSSEILPNAQDILTQKANIDARDKEKLIAILKVFYQTQRAIFTRYLADETFKNLKAVTGPFFLPKQITNTEVNPTHFSMDKETVWCFEAVMHQFLQQPIYHTYQDENGNQQDTPILNLPRQNNQPLPIFIPNLHCSTVAIDSPMSRQNIKASFDNVTKLHQSCSAMRIVIGININNIHWIGAEIRVKVSKTITFSSNEFNSFCDNLNNFSVTPVVFIVEENKPLAVCWKENNGKETYYISLSITFNPNKYRIELTKKELKELKTDAKYSDYELTKNEVTQVLGIEHHALEPITHLCCRLISQPQLRTTCAFYDGLKLLNSITIKAINQQILQLIFSRIACFGPKQFAMAVPINLGNQYIVKKSQGQHPEDGASCGAIFVYVATALFIGWERATKLLQLPLSQKPISFPKGAPTLRLKLLQLLARYNENLAQQFYNSEFGPIILPWNITQLASADDEFANIVQNCIPKMLAISEQPATNERSTNLSNYFEPKSTLANTISQLRADAEEFSVTTLEALLHYVFSDSGLLLKKCRQLLEFTKATQNQDSIYHELFDTAKNDELRVCTTTSGKKKPLNDDVMRKIIIKTAYTKLRQTYDTTPNLAHKQAIEKLLTYIDNATNNKDPSLTSIRALYLKLCTDWEKIDAPNRVATLETRNEEAIEKHLHRSLNIERLDFAKYLAVLKKYRNVISPPAQFIRRFNDIKTDLIINFSQDKYRDVLREIITNEDGKIKLPIRSVFKDQLKNIKDIYTQLFVNWKMITGSSKEIDEDDLWHIIFESYLMSLKRELFDSPINKLFFICRKINKFLLSIKEFSERNINSIYQWLEILYFNCLQFLSRWFRTISIREKFCDGLDKQLWETIDEFPDYAGLFYSFIKRLFMNALRRDIMDQKEIERYVKEYCNRGESSKARDIVYGWIESPSHSETDRPRLFKYMEALFAPYSEENIHIDSLQYTIAGLECEFELATELKQGLDLDGISQQLQYIHVLLQRIGITQINSEFKERIKVAVDGARVKVSQPKKKTTQALMPGEYYAEVPGYARDGHIEEINKLTKNILELLSSTTQIPSQDMINIVNDFVTQKTNSAIITELELSLILNEEKHATQIINNIDFNKTVPQQLFITGQKYELLNLLVCKAEKQNGRGNMFYNLIQHLLYEKKYHPDKLRISNGRNLFHLAIWHGKLFFIQELLKKHKININQPPPGSKYTPMDLVLDHLTTAMGYYTTNMTNTVTDDRVVHWINIYFTLKQHEAITTEDSTLRMIKLVNTLMSHKAKLVRLANNNIFLKFTKDFPTLKQLLPEMKNVSGTKRQPDRNTDLNLQPPKKKLVFATKACEKKSKDLSFFNESPVNTNPTNGMRRRKRGEKDGYNEEEGSRKKRKFNDNQESQNPQ